MSKYVRAARGLPKDPGHALATFAERASRIHLADEDARGFLESESLSVEDSEFIINFVQKFTARFGITIDMTFPEDISSPEKASKILLLLNTQLKPALISNVISCEVDDVINEFLDSQDESFGLARLNEEERTKIHAQINNVREILASSVLSDRKKNALYERLNRLASEVDAHGTRTERFFAFMGDIAFVMGDMAEKAKPLFKEVKEMMRILARSRARQEGVSLPPGDDVILLPKPGDDA